MGMPTEATIRRFLLGMTDPEAEKTIEEGILSGVLSTEDVALIEEELIDDHIFGRLSPEEETAFHAKFLIVPERRSLVAFSRAMQEYARKHAPPRRQGAFSMGYIPRFALATSFALLGVVTLSVAWLETRNIRLVRELAGVSQTSDERQRLLASLMEQEKQRTALPERASAVGGVAAESKAIPSAVMSGIQLRPGVRRGVEAIPVLHVAGEPGAVRITLELAFNPSDGLREELFHAGGKRIWNQELSSAGPVVAHGSTTVYVPSQLLTPGDYQIRVKDLSGDASDDGDVYAFRVSR